MSGSIHLALAPEVEAFRRQFDEIAAEAEALVAPLTDAQLYWRPAPDAWSIAECLEHLNVTARVYLPSLDAGIAEAVRRGCYGRGPYHYNPLGRLLVWAEAPPPRIRLRAPRPFVPVPRRPRHELMAAFKAYQVQYVDRLRQSNGVDLARARVALPRLPWLRIPLGSGFALTIAHERRHLWQARAVLSRAAAANV